MAGEPAQITRARLSWRCRRGIRELDLLLQRWLQRGYAGAGQGQRVLFEALLELPDPQLADYLLGGAQAPQAALARLIEAIRAPGTADGAERLEGAAGAEGAGPGPQRGPPPEAPSAVLCLTEVTGTSGEQPGPIAV